MAETKKNTTASDAKSTKRVQVKLPRLNGQNAIQEEFYSVNGRNYIVKRGEYVDVPEEVAELIRNNEQTEESGLLFIYDLNKGEEIKRAEMLK